MTDYDLKKLNLIARGGEAEIYDAGNGKILRVVTRPGVKLLEAEKNLFPALYENHISVPHIYELLEIDGKPAELMQKINGQNLLGYMMHSPLKIPQIMKKMALLQSRIFDVKTDKLTTIKDRVQYFASRPPLLEKQLLDFILKLFAELPEENYLCHGDFHPGNILMQGDGYYIIDWSGAYVGSYLCDVAHTYLLMRCVPRVPGQSSINYSVTKKAGAFIAKSYLKEISKLRKYDRAAFSKWTVIMSFLRVYCGLPSERDGRINYIGKCFKLNEQNIDAVLWYKQI
jgi:tRNA A-37 threonylcarbamoyl transferase component Bud32